MAYQWQRLMRQIGRRFIDDRCPQIAAGLAYTTLLSIVPLVAVVLTIAAAFPFFGHITSALDDFLLQNFVPAAAAAVGKYVDRFIANAGKLTALGVAFLAATAVLLLFTMERAFNDIWRIRRPRRFIQRLLVYLALVAVGPPLLGLSLTLTTWVVTQSLRLADMPGGQVLGLAVIPFFLTTIALAVVYSTLPARRIRPVDALWGGLVAGLAFEAAKRGFAFYIAHVPTYRLIYGALATLPVFLIWIYVSWLMVLLGAVVVAVLPDWRAGMADATQVPGSEFLGAIKILQTLGADGGRVRDIVVLQSVVSMPLEHIEATLEIMETRQWVRHTGAGRWKLSCPLARIAVADVYALFVFDGTLCPVDEMAHPEFTRLLRTLASAGSDLRISVAEISQAIRGNSEPGAA